MSLRCDLRSVFISHLPGTLRQVSLRPFACHRCAAPVNDTSRRTGGGPAPIYSNTYGIASVMPSSSLSGASAYAHVAASNDRVRATVLHGRTRPNPVRILSHPARMLDRREKDRLSDDCNTFGHRLLQVTASEAQSIVNGPHGDNIVRSMIGLHRSRRRRPSRPSPPSSHPPSPPSPPPCPRLLPLRSPLPLLPPPPTLVAALRPLGTVGNPGTDLRPGWQRYMDPRAG